MVQCTCTQIGPDEWCSEHGYAKAPTRPVEKFATGATRDMSTDKPDFEAFLSPLVIHAYGRFMHYNRELEDGTLRAGDNWQLGIPQDNYIKSGWRHVVDWWLWHRGHGNLAKQTLVWTLCAILFNVSGYLHELLSQDPGRVDVDENMERLERDERRKRK